MNVQEKRMKPYDTLVLSGGLTKGFGIVGALQHLQDKGILSQVHKYIGTSIGAIISYLVCIGYNPIELMIVSCQKKIFEKMTNIDILNVMHGNGAISFHIFQEILEKMTIEKVKRYITLMDLYTKYNKELVCCTYNLTLQKSEYISYKTHPHLDCITALRMSANLPFFFETFVYDDSRYVDGGIADNFPISIVDKEKDVALGIRTKTILSSDPDKKENDNLLSQFISILTIPIARIEEIQMERCQETIHIVSVPIPSYMSLSLHLTNTEKFDLFSVGYETMKQFLEQ